MAYWSVLERKIKHIFIFLSFTSHKMSFHRYKLKVLGLFTILTHFWFPDVARPGGPDSKRYHFSLFLSKSEIIQRVDIKQCYQYPFPIYLSPVKP